MFGRKKKSSPPVATHTADKTEISAEDCFFTVVRALLKASVPVVQEYRTVVVDVRSAIEDGRDIQIQPGRLRDARLTAMVESFYAAGKELGHVARVIKNNADLLDFLPDKVLPQGVLDACGYEDEFFVTHFCVLCRLASGTLVITKDYALRGGQLWRCIIDEVTLEVQRLEDSN